MFKKILVANRGEIACRVICTAKKLGIGTVVIYHPIEQHALYVKMADEAVAIETDSPRAAYLDIDKIIAAAKKLKAEAIHPGYGFLAENALFAEACAKAGVKFIGPSPEALKLMGRKDQAKLLMQKKQVPVIPGYEGEDQSITTLQREAQRIGFPLLLKAVAGGGGKAMRRVSSIEELSAVLPVVQREAQQSFADAHIILEKYLPQARHIEVQIFGDQQQNYVHLFERDCSLQRRYQKILEEAPAKLLTETVRAGLHQSALRAAEAINYEGAGTVEFLVTEDAYYFLEMNTRLQVEHPVTEFITGIDLVEWQLRVAAGEKLPVKQTDLKVNGHAIEVRICAEDPEYDFMPAIGRVESLHYPSTTSFLRLENGIQSGDKITPYFDSLLAKLVIWGETREIALQRITTALENTTISGVKTNIHFLLQLVQRLAQLSKPVYTQVLANLAQFFASDLSPWQQNSGWRLNADRVETQPFLLAHHLMDSHHEPGVYAPMPGIIVQVYVQEEQKVAAGERLLSLEAMKMEHTIRAPSAGVVQKLYCKVGDLVNVGATLVEFVADSL